MKFAKSGFVVMLLVVLLCMVSAHGAKIRTSPLTTGDLHLKWGQICIELGATMVNKNSVHFDAVNSIPG